jgi:hypothetical protein
MKIAQSVRIGLWLLIGLNLFMALGSIWIFMRMAPAIEVIIDRNERSLQACEEMLASLAMITEDRAENEVLKITFVNALKRAQNNITENEEPVALESIRVGYSDSFIGNITARQNTVSAIILLGKINREAMIKADLRAKQFGYAGAWGIVFMAVGVFFAGMLFKRSLSKSLIKPLEEIHAVISAHRDGDTIRRCTGSNLPRDIKIVLNGLNEFLDKENSISTFLK